MDANGYSRVYFLICRLKQNTPKQPYNLCTRCRVTYEFARRVPMLKHYCAILLPFFTLMVSNVSRFIGLVFRCSTTCLLCEL